MTRLLISTLLVGLIGIGSAYAERPKPFPDFSAKRIKPPKAGSTGRINIQIDPQAPAAAAPVAARPETVTSSASGSSIALGRYSWFWDKISPEATSSGPGRLQTATAVLAGASTKVAAPRMQQMQDIARVNGIDILRSTVGTKVSPALVLAVITVESSGNPQAVSTAGAQGLMQLMPDTAARFGVTDSLEPAQNISGGVKYLDWLMEKFDRDPILVLAGYNAGAGSVRDHAGVPPFAETRDYVPKVLSAFQVAKGLCITPPALVTDGCVFVSMD